MANNAFKYNPSINYGFWKDLAQPFFMLAPMADITDTVFRQIISRYSTPDAYFTEFVSCDGLCSAGRQRLLVDLQFSSTERPIVAQFFGARPENFYKSAQLAIELGFDGIDINTGCPDKSIVRQEAGSALMRTPERIPELIAATKEGAGSLPVSVKTRLGYSFIDIEEWLPLIIDAKPALITIHGRTKKEMYKGETHWDSISRCVDMAAGSGVLVAGNGDIENRAHGVLMAKQSGAQGIMIGRASMGNPWIFNIDGCKKDQAQADILKVLLEHADLFEHHYQGVRRYVTMRKHFKAYISDFPGAKLLRKELMQARDSVHTRKIVDEFLSDYDRLPLDTT